MFGSGQEQFWNNPDVLKDEAKGSNEDEDEDTNM
jgi:hypothetical protein